MKKKTNEFVFGPRALTKLDLMGIRFITDTDNKDEGANLTPEGGEGAQSQEGTTVEPSKALEADKETPLKEEAPEGKTSTSTETSDEDENLDDDEETIPDADEDEEIDWEKIAPTPKSVAQARSLRNENKKIKQTYRKLKASYDKLVLENETRAAEEAQKAKDEALVGSKKQILKDFNLSEEDIDLFVGEDETVWKKLAQRVSQASPQRITNNTPSNGTKNLTKEVAVKDAYKTYVAKK